MTLHQALKIAKSYSLEREFWASYREIKPWYAFWVSEAEAIIDTLIDLDI